MGAYGGRRELMEQVSPLGGVYQAGTLSGNPLAVAAGLATLPRARRSRGVPRGSTRSARAWSRDSWTPPRARACRSRVNRVGSMLTAFFSGAPVVDLASAKRSDTARYARFFHGMLERGVFLAASQFEAAFVSLAHTDEDLEAAGRAARETLKTLA